MTDLTGHVHATLAKHYPQHVLGWVKQATWTRDPAVPLSRIDMSRRPGGRDPQKVAGIAQAVTDGKPMPPVVLVDTGDGKLQIADGYHRTLGFQHAGKTKIPALIASGVGAHGPWEKRMHDAKLNLTAEHVHVFDLAGTCTGPGPCDTSSFGAGKNWVNKVGGLPDYIRAVAHAFHRKGLSESEAIQRAVGVVKNWAEGKGGVSAATRARAAAAVAEWEAKKAASHSLTAAPAATVDLAEAGHVYHWKHGWIPITPHAALQKAHGSHAGAARILHKNGQHDDAHLMLRAGARHHEMAGRGIAAQKYRVAAGKMQDKQLGKLVDAMKATPAAKPLTAHARGDRVAVKTLAGDHAYHGTVHGTSPDGHYVHVIPDGKSGPSNVEIVHQSAVATAPAHGGAGGKVGNETAIGVRKNGSKYETYHTPSGSRISEHSTKSEAEAVRQEMANTPHNLNVTAAELRQNKPALDHLQTVARDAGSRAQTAKIEASRVAQARKLAGVGAAVSNPSKPGDLAVFSTKEHHATIGKNDVVTEHHTPGVVTHVGKNGRVLAIRDARGDLHTVDHRTEVRTMPQDQIDAHGLMAHVAATNRYGNSEHLKAHYDSMTELQAAARRFSTATSPKKTTSAGTRESRTVSMAAAPAETVDLSWSEQAHPRGGKGTAAGGKFVAKNSAPGAPSTPAGMTGNVRDFQKRMGLPVTGIIDAATAAAIARETAAKGGAGGKGKHKGRHKKPRKVTAKVAAARARSTQRRTVGQHIAAVNSLSVAQRTEARRRMPVPPTGYVWGKDNTLRAVKMTRAQQTAPLTGI